MDGVVTEIGITYGHLHTGEGVLAMPSAQVLAAAAGPAAPPPGASRLTSAAPGPGAA